MTKDLQNRFNELVNGEGTRYAVILDALRNNLQSDIQTTDGCIAFYNYDIENTGTMLMKVFPYRPEVIASYFPSDVETQLAVLERINADRPYAEMHHLKNFRNKFKSKSHFNLTIPDKEVLVHDKKKINGNPWSTFANDGKIENNIFDNLLFSSEEKSFQIFPLPVLSSPCMLLIIPASEHVNAPDTIAAKIRESIDFYLYNRLLTEVSKDLKPRAINDKKELIEVFLRELSQVAIPIKYEFNGKVYNCFDWYGDWKTDTCATVHLTLAAEPVKIFMPTFCWYDGTMLHKIPHYDVKVKQVTETIQNIFGLVFGYWKTINSERGLLQDQIIPLISDLKSKAAAYESIRDGVEETNRKIEVLTKLITKLEPDKEVEMDFELKSFVKKENGIQIRCWKFRYNGETLEKEATDKGFEYLQVILNSPDRDIQLEELSPTLARTAKTKEDFKTLYKSASDSAEKIFKRINQYGGYDNADFNDLKSLAQHLAQKKYAGNNLKYKVADDTQKLNNCLAALKFLLTEEEFNEFKHQVDEIGKTEKRNESGRADNFLRSTVQLRDRLLTRYPQIETHFSKQVLKIGSPSSYRPNAKDKVSWNSD